MSESAISLPKNPVVEMVLDIECDMPPGFQLSAMEVGARQAFASRYPVCRTQFVQEHRIETKPEAPLEYSICHGVQAFQFVTVDEKEIAQVRNTGFSFNRLAGSVQLAFRLSGQHRTRQALA